MKRVFSAATILSAFVAVLFWSCAKDAPDLGKDLARRSFEAWVKKNAPNAVPYKDIYIEFIERGPEGAPQPVRDNTWLSLDYTGVTLDGTVFATRDEDVSKLIGNYKYSTHFTADFTFYESASQQKMCAGMHQAFEEMRQGDSVRVYIPADKAYSSSMTLNSGYQGEASAGYTGMPVIFNMRFKDMVLLDQVQRWEIDSVERYAKQKWGTDYITDTNNFGIFLKITEPNPEGDTITKDSMVWVYYEELFLDEFLCSTNIDSVATARHVFDQTKAEEGAYEARSISPSVYENVDQKALYLAVLYMRKGESADVVVGSYWAYGYEGVADGAPEVQPYHPMLYRITILEKGPESEEEL